MKNKNRSNIARRSNSKIGALGVFLALVSGSATAYYCASAGNPAAIMSLKTLLQKADLIETQALNRLDANVTRSIKNQQDSLSSAIKILTKQEALAAQGITDNAHKNAQSFVSAYQAANQADKLKEVQFEYGSHGQAFKACEVLSDQEQAANDIKSANSSVIDLINKEVLAAPGTYLNPHEAQKAMIQAHEEFCTPSQASSGLCSLGENAGLNLQGATLFTVSAQGTAIHRAQNGLINNMVGLPDAPIDAKIAKTNIGQDYLMAKLSKDAMISPAITSLKAIQAQYSLPSGGETNSHDSSNKLAPIQHLEKSVSRYLGTGDEYKEWSKAQAAKAERGLMVDGLVQATEHLNISYQLYKSNERKEAILASLVAAESKLADGTISYHNNRSQNASDIRRIAMTQALSVAANK